MGGWKDRQDPDDRAIIVMTVQFQAMGQGPPSAASGVRAT